MGSMTTTWKPKTYHDDGRTLKWEDSLTPEQEQAMQGGEVFTLLDAEGTPHSIVLKDSYGQIREDVFVQPLNEMTGEEKELTNASA